MKNSISIVTDLEKIHFTSYASYKFVELKLFGNTTLELAGNRSRENLQWLTQTRNTFVREERKRWMSGNNPKPISVLNLEILEYPNFNNSYCRSWKDTLRRLQQNNWACTYLPVVTRKNAHNTQCTKSNQFKFPTHNKMIIVISYVTSPRKWGSVATSLRSGEWYASSSWILYFTIRLPSTVELFWYQLLSRHKVENLVSNAEQCEQCLFSCCDSDLLLLKP